MRFILYLSYHYLSVRGVLLANLLALLLSLASAAPAAPPVRTTLPDPGSVTWASPAWIRPNWIGPGRPLPRYPLFFILPRREQADSDPIRFTIQSNQQSIRLGETVELIITAELLNISPSLLFTLPGANAFRLKLLLPPGFEQTGGDFVDYIGDQLSYPSHTTTTYRIKGYFTSVKAGTQFQLLRSHSQADAQSLFVEKSAITLQPIGTDQQPSIAADQPTRTRNVSTLFVDMRDVRANARVASNYMSHLDAATCDYVTGWIIDFNNKNSAPTADIYINGNKAASVVATVIRKDVADAYGITTYNQYGFVYNIPASYRTNAPLTISVRYAGSSDNIINSPLTTASCTAPASTTTTPPSSTTTAPPSSTTTAPPSNTTTAPVATTVTSIPPVNPNADYFGFLDVASCDSIRGWAFDRNVIKQSVGVDLFINGTKVATLLANRSRPDVARYFNIQGFDAYEYAYKIPDTYKKNATITVAARIANTNRELVNSPRTTAVCTTTVVAPVVKPDTCQFTLSTTPSLSVGCGSSVTLSAACTGANCNRLSYAWKGSGLSQTGQTISFSAPATNGTTSYTVTATASGCASQMAVASVTVSGCVAVTATTPPSSTTTAPVATTVTSIPPVNPNADYFGFLDVASCDSIRGWAFDRNVIKQSVGVDLFINGTKVATLLANRSRPDVARYFNIQGFDAYEYAYKIPDTYKKNATITVAARIANTNRELVNSPRTTAVCTTTVVAPVVKPDTCQFTLSTTPSLSVGCGSSVTLSAACTGANCNRLSYAWKGSGLSQTGQTISFSAPATNGTTSYTVTASASGCASQMAVASVTVSGCVAVTATTPPSNPSNAKYQGFLETANCETIAGWLIDLNNPKQSQAVDIYLNSIKVATVTATRNRQDVADAYGIQGYNTYGYFYAIPANFKSNAPLKVSVMPTATTRDLSLSPRTTAVCPGNGQAPTTPPADTCQFTLGTMNPLTAGCGSAIVLNAGCSGANCNRVTYTWKGNGLTATGQTINLTAPSANGSTSYTLTASANGCASQSVTGTVSVTGCATAPTPTTVVTPPAPTTPVTTNAKYVGFLETANCDGIAGWVIDISNPKRSPSVDIYLNGVKVATVTADRNRQDVADAYSVQGYNTYGYFYAIPANFKNNTPLKVSVVPTATTRDLSLSPRTTAVCPGNGQAPTAPAPVADSCQFSLSTSPFSLSCGTSITLQASCSRATYTWAGNGTTQTGQQVTLTAPSVNGTTTYTVTAAATGCPSQSATFDLIVSGCADAPTTPAPPVVTVPTTPTAVTNARYQGFLETANCDNIAGWVLDVNNPKRSPSVDIYLNSVKVATIAADRNRQDVADAYGIQGYNTYGYLYAVPDAYKSNAPLRVSVVPSATTTDLSLSPRTTASCAGTGQPPTTTPPTTGTGTGCQFALTTTSVNTSCGSTVTLNATCTGANCDRVTYSWTGGGISQSGQSITFNAPASNGTTTYTVIGSANGCSNQTATATVTVSGCASTPTDQGDYPVLTSPYPSDKRPVLQNDRVRVAVDLGVGGVIREVTDLQVGENMINCMEYSDGRRDPGRDDQISLYGMPNAATGWTVGGKPVLDDIGYNPVQGGDIAGNFSPMLGYGRTDKVLYTKTRNLLWGINNEPGHYIVEQWIRLDGNVVKRHVKITGNRPDNTKYDDVRQQELPCTYTNSAYYQYYIVQGDPYTNAPSINVNNIPNLGGSGQSLNQFTNRGQMGPLNVDSSEPWIAAIRPSTGRGMALHTPYAHEFKVGLFNEVGWGPPTSISAGYIANTVSMPLDANGVYEFDINMVVGTLSEIRNTMTTLPRSETKPNYIFNGSPTRCGFYYRKGYDQGYPINNELVITPTDRRFKIVSPNKGYRASETPTLYVRMRAITTETRMILEWRKVGQTELEAAQANQTITFTVQGDNQYHTIAIPTGQNSKWSGTISNFSIRYDNVSETPVSGQQFGVKWISATNLGDF